MVTAQATLSVVLIVRNEEAVLRDCLASVADVADQLVVVDTGSEDGTVAIAEAFQAEIHHFPWVDDFSAARNEMLRHATCDWIMYLDADEMLMEDSRDALRALLQPVDGPVLYSVIIRNLLEDQVSYSITRAHRLFTNGHNLRFSGKIHEQVYPSFKGPADGNRGCNVFFTHRGYAQGPEKLQQKQQRNIILLEQEAAENPGSTYAHYMHGQGLVQLQRHAEAHAAFSKALDLGGFDDPVLASLHSAMAATCVHLDRLEEAESNLLRSLELIPKQVTANHFMYRLHKAGENLARQIQYLEKTEICNREAREGKLSVLPQDVLLPPNEIDTPLGALYLKSQRFTEAETTFKRAIGEQPDNRQLAELLGLAVGFQGRWEEALEIWRPLEPPFMAEVRDLRGVCYLKLGRLEDAAGHYEQWLADDASNAEVRKRLAGLYAKLGRMAEAKQLLADQP